MLQPFPRSTGEKTQKKSTEKRKRDSEDDKKKSPKKAKVVEMEVDKSYLDREEDLNEFAHKMPLTPGTLALGTISQIHSLKLRIQLPNRKFGEVSILEISDSITEYLNKLTEEGVEIHRKFLENRKFSIGQIVPVCVLSTSYAGEGKKLTGIQLSMRESVINKYLTPKFLQKGSLVYGSVKSIEEYGYRISLGIDKVNAFCAFSNSTPKDKFKIGEVQFFYVTDKQNENNIQLSADSTAKKIYRDKGIVFDTIKPGQLIKCEYFVGLEDGICVQIDKFFGTVSDFHKFDRKGKLKEGDVLHGRVLFVDADDKKIGLSLLPHIVNLEKYETNHFVGEKLKGCKVVGVNKKFASLKFGKESQIFTLESENNEGDVNVNPGEIIKNCRITTISTLDASIFVSRDVQVLKAQYIDVSEINIGDIIEGTIEIINDSNLIIKISDRVRVFCPLFHAFNVNTGKQDLNAKFKIGESVRCRALYFSSDKQALFVTMKRSLIDSQYEIINEITPDIKNKTVSAVILSVDPKFSAVGLFNNFRGRIYSHFLPQDELDLYKNLQVGQVVTSTITKVDMHKNALFLNLGTAGTAPDHGVTFSSPHGVFSIGQIVNNVVVWKRKLDQLFLTVNDDNGNTYRGIIEIDQLSDFKYYSDLYSEMFIDGTTINGLMVKAISQQEYIFFTKRKSLFYASENGMIKRDLSTIELDKQYVGEVFVPTGQNRIHPSIMFLGGARCESRSKHIQDFVPKQLTVFQIQSSTDETTNNNNNNNREKCKIIPENEISDELILLRTKSLLEDKEYFDSLVKNKKIFKKFIPGTIIEGTVKEIKPVGCLISFEGASEIIGFAGLLQCRGTEEKGKKVKCFVLDVDKRRNVVDLSLLPRLVEKTTSLPKLVKKATIELINQRYIIFSVPVENNYCKLAIVVPSYNDTKKIIDRYTLLEEHLINIIEESNNNNPYLIGRIGDKGRYSSKPISQLSIIDEKTSKPLIEVGKIVKIEITKSKDPHILVAKIVDTSFFIQIYVTDIYDDDYNLTKLNNPENNFKRGTIHDCRVIQILERNKYSVINSTKLEIYGSLKPSVLSSKNLPKILSKNELTASTNYIGYIFYSNQEKKDETIITLNQSIKGKIENSDNIIGIESGKVQRGQKVSCEVIQVEPEIIFGNVKVIS